MATSKTERLEQLIDYYSEGKPTLFAQKIGVAPSTISSWLARNTLDYDLIFAKCEDISPEWLLTGHGNMIKQEEEDFEITQIHYPRSIERKHDIQTIKVYNLQASAGVQSLWDNGDENVIDTLYISNMPKCDGAVFITGDSMLPLLRPNDLILFRTMPLEEASIIYNQMYLLAFEYKEDFYTVCKYIKRSKKGFPYVVLASENPKHEDKEIHFGGVKAIGLVKASVRYCSIV